MEILFYNKEQIHISNLRNIVPTKENLKSFLKDHSFFKWKNSYVNDLKLQQLQLNKMIIIFNVAYVQIV